MNRYARQLALPEMDLIKQERLQNAAIVMVGAGGLGSPALPYLAAAGIGQITIIDHDHIDITNLHRQTIYKTSDEGQNKAECAAEYLRALNPDINVTAITDRLTADNAQALLGDHDYDLILDGSDNFATKALLNDLSIALHIPLLSASVNQFGGQIGLFEGYRADKACYRCLFPDFPSDARNCNEAGILGTSAGIVGMMQAHIALLHLSDNINDNTSNFISLNLKTLRNENITLIKDKGCTCCQNAAHTKPAQQQSKDNKTMVDLISIDTLNDQDTLIVDVRQPEELAADPIRHDNITAQPLHIPLPELISRLDELPQDKRLAFICAGNIRSRQAAEYLDSKGGYTVCILDKFSL